MILTKTIHESMITPYKGREIDRKEKVRIYRNLNRKGHVYSIQQFGLVVGYTTDIKLYDCEFVVMKGGKNRALETKTRNVHAFIDGYVCMFFEGDALVGNIGNIAKPAKIRYYPFDENGFVCTNYDKEPIEITHAKGVVIDEDGVTGYNCKIKN